MRVLVVEDEASIASYLVPLLEREGFQASAVATGTAALAAVRACRPDLVLLDVGLPDLSGLEVCRALRRLPGHLPVVMLTGQTDPGAELLGFQARADDYIGKPIAPELLLARVRAVLRRSGHTRIGIGSVELDLRTQEVLRAGRPVPLAARDVQLLSFLAEHPGQVFGPTQLLHQVWGPDYAGTAHTVESRISKLRAAVEDNPNRPRHLHTRRGLGYFLTLEPRG